MLLYWLASRAINIMRNKKAYDKEYRLAHKEKLSAQHKEWYLKNRAAQLLKKKEYMLKHKNKNNARTKKWKKKHPGACKAWYEDNRHRISLNRTFYSANKKGHSPCYSSLDRVEQAFTGHCHVCGVPEKECTSKLHLDHNHITGEFRGWLCSRCNLSLGLVNDDPKLLTSLLNYINKNQTEQVEVK